MKSLQPDLDASRPAPISWERYREWLDTEWGALLESDPSEKSVQRFLEANPCLLPGGLGDIGPGGHHGPELDAVFRQPIFKGLARTRVPDFMWVTRSTSLITPICIEIERPGKYWFNSDGTPTATLTQSLDQLTDWKVWFSEPENQLIFRRTYLWSDYESRALDPQYVLIYGRRREFSRAYGRHEAPSRLSKKRDFMRRKNEHFMTFDSLVPQEERRDFVTATLTAKGPRVEAIPPTFTLGPSVSELVTTMRDPQEAIKKTPLWSDARREYVLSRWLHWQRVWDAPPEFSAYSPARGE